MSDKPMRFGGLGWIQVDKLRPEGRSYSGKGYVNLDLFKRIQFPEDQPGVAIGWYPDGTSESFEEGNHSRLLKAIEDARFND